MVSTVGLGAVLAVLIRIDRQRELSHRRAEQRVVVAVHGRQLGPGRVARNLEALEGDGIHLEAVFNQALDGGVHLVAKLGQRMAKPGGEINAPMLAPGVGHLARPAELDLFHDRASIGQGGSGGQHLALDLAVDDVVAKVHVDCESQPANVVGNRRGPVDRGRLRQRITIVIPGGGEEKQASIIDGAGERTEVVDRVPARRHHIEGNAPKRGLESDQAAIAGRDSHRAAHVGAFGKRNATCCDGHGRPARRAARVELGIPRIARCPPERAARETRIGELGRRRLADHDRTSRVHPLDDHAVVVGHPMLVRVRPERRAIALGGGQIFDRDRHAVEWAERLAICDGLVGTMRLLEGALAEDKAETVELRVDLGDAVERALHDCDRRELT